MTNDEKDGRGEAEEREQKGKEREGKDSRRKVERRGSVGRATNEMSCGGMEWDRTGERNEKRMNGLMVGKGRRTKGRKE